MRRNPVLKDGGLLRFVGQRSILDELSRLEEFVIEHAIEVELIVDVNGDNEIITGTLLADRFGDRVNVALGDGLGVKIVLRTQVINLLHDFVRCPSLKFEAAIA